MTQIFWRRVQEQVALTGQQLTDTYPLLRAQRTVARADVQDLIAARKKLRTLLEQPTIDLGATQSAAAQVKSLQAELFDQRLQRQLALLRKLTPEYRAYSIELRKDRGHHGTRGGHAFGPGAGKTARHAPLLPAVGGPSGPGSRTPPGIVHRRGPGRPPPAPHKLSDAGPSGSQGHQLSGIAVPEVLQGLHTLVYHRILIVAGTGRGRTKSMWTPGLLRVAIH